MTKPFEDIKEPRFSNTYVKGTAKRMFNNAPDVYTYGTFDNVDDAFTVTNITFPQYPHQAVVSNIDTVTLYGTRCWVIVYNGTLPTNWNVYGQIQGAWTRASVKIIDVVTGSTLGDIQTPLNPYQYVEPYSSSTVTGSASADGGTHSPFIMGGNIYLVSRLISGQSGPNTPTYTSKLYKLVAGNTWQLVADNVLWPGGQAYGEFSYYGTTNSSGGLTKDNGWWGLRNASGTYNHVSSDDAELTGGLDSHWLVNLKPDGTVAEYTGLTIPFSWPHTGFWVANDKIYTAGIDSGTNTIHKMVYGISGTPSVLLQQTSANTAAYELPYYYAVNTDDNSVIDFNGAGAYRRTYSAGSITTSSYTGYTAPDYGPYPGGDPWIPFSGTARRSTKVVGWNLKTANNGTLIAHYKEAEGMLPDTFGNLPGGGAPYPQPNVTPWVKFKADNTVEQFWTAGKVRGAALDLVTNRVWMISLYSSTYYNKVPFIAYQQMVP